MGVFRAHELTEHQPSSFRHSQSTRLTSERVVYIGTGSTCCSSVYFVCCEQAFREGTAATCCRKVTSLCRPSATWLTKSITRLSLSPCDTQLITPKSYSSLANVPLRDSCCNCRTHGTNFVFDTIIMGSRQMSSQVAGTSSAAHIRHQYYRINYRIYDF